MAVTDFLERGARVNPDGVCLVQGELHYSYRQVRGLMNRMANRLLAEGYGLGRHAAVLCDNDAVGFACTLGIMRAGMAYVPLDFRNSPEDNRRIVDFADAEVLFYQARFQGELAEILPRLPKLKLRVCIDALQDWLGSVGDAAPAVEIPMEATAWLQTGSGTSGDFKMAVMSHRAYHAFAAYTLLWLPDPDPVSLVAAPITHAAGGLAYPVLAVGGRLVLIDRPDPQRVLSAIAEHGITQLFLPPTVIYRLMAQPNVGDFDLSSLKYLIYSAAPMAVEKLRQALDIFGPVIAQGYGQTEALGIAFMRPHEFYDRDVVASDFRLAAAGRPALPFCRVAILDDRGAPLPDGETGEICVRGDQVMSGYYKNAEATAATIVDGWTHTGDVGFFDADGYLHITDRKKDMIITGGFNVFSAEVEQVLTAHPAVYECAVIGVPDAEWGEAVKAVVVLDPGRDAGAEELIAWCKKTLGSVKSPKTIDFVEDLPRSQRGKVLKGVLRAPYWLGRDRQV